jgi:hypothetical protein
MEKQNNIRPTSEDPVKRLVHSLEPMIEAIQKQQKQCLKQLEHIVRDAIASKNHKENELGRLADSLSEMALFSGASGELYHEFLEYIDTFNPELAQWYRDNDIEMSGVYDDMIEEAANLAKVFHQGQKDKAGIDYFEGHLTYVGNSGGNWKEKIVGFLHDVAEDTPHTVEEIMNLLKAKSNGTLSNEDAQEIEAALTLLNSTTASSREEYISRIKDSLLATKVKLNDLRHNMDLSHIPDPTPKDRERLLRYKKEYEQVLGYLGTVDKPVRR